MWSMEIKSALNLRLALDSLIHMVATWEEANISFPIIYFGPHHGIACE